MERGILGLALGNNWQKARRGLARLGNAIKQEWQLFIDAVDGVAEYDCNGQLICEAIALDGGNIAYIDRNGNLLPSNTPLKLW